MTMWKWVERLSDRFAARDPRNQTLSIGDPRLAEFFGVGPANYSGATVTESSAMALSAVHRAVSLISGTIGTLVLRSLRDTGDGMRQRVSSFMDNPGGPDGLTPYEWTETVVAHLLLGGDAFLAHQRAGGGQLIGLIPIHPGCVNVQWATVWPDDPTRPVVGGKLFTATLADGKQHRFDASTMLHIPGLSLDGLRGMSVITAARNSLGTAIAGDRAAAKMFSSGALISGMVTPEEDVEEDEAKTIKASINGNVSGWENAGSIAVINRKLKFTPWTLSAVDAQFLQSRQFQIEEIARWFGVPPHLLMQTDKQTSWGQGVNEQNRGLGRYVLHTWTTRIEQRVSRLLGGPVFVEYDFATLERPDAAQEIDLLIKQVDSGLLTLNEARAIRNMPPVEGGDVVRRSVQSAPAAEPAPEPAPQPEAVPA